MLLAQAGARVIPSNSVPHQTNAIDVAELLAASIYFKRNFHTKGAVISDGRDENLALDIVRHAFSAKRMWNEIDWFNRYYRLT